MAIKASALIALSSVTDVTSVTRYYLLQSSTLARPAKPTTKPPTGSWTDTEPTYTEGSTNSLYFVDLTVFSDGTWSYSSVSLSSSYEAAKAAYNKATSAQTTAVATQTEVVNLDRRVTSRGDQMVTNGNGLLGNNTNFSALTYDPTVSNSSNGSFTRTGNSATVISDEYIALIAGVNYRFEFDAKSANGLSSMYSMLVFYDSDKRSILAYHHMYIANTLTTLARDLKNGDTVVYLTSAANWKVNTGSATYQRGLIFWNYTNDSGYTYPESTYSRNIYTNLYASDSAVNKTANTITLSSAWNKGAFPAGTKVSQSNSGGNYKYIAASNSVIPASWQHYAGIMKGEVDYSGTNVSGKLPPGVAYARIGFLWNYNSSADQVWVTNLSLKEDYTTPIQTAQSTANAAQSTATAAQTTASSAQTAASAAQETAESAQSTADAARTEFQRVVRINDEGLHVGDNQSNGEVLIDSNSVNVVFNGQKYSKFAANYVQFGNYQLRRSSDGGLVFKLS